MVTKHVLNGIPIAEGIVKLPVLTAGQAPLNDRQPGLSGKWTQLKRPGLYTPGRDK